MRRALLVTASLLSLGSGGPTLAATIAGEIDEPTPVDPLTVIATRTAVQVSEAPSTVSVIPALQIEDQLVTDIKDLVRYEPGVSVRQSPARFSAALGATGRDGASGFNIRGLEGNRVLIQVDGVRLPDAFSFGAQSVGRGDYVDLDLIKSVEILRGPASALYGSDGVAGAVSFMTKDPADLMDEGERFHARGRIAYSSADGGLSEGLVLAGAGARWSGMVAYTRRDSEELDNQGDVEGTGSARTAPNPQDIASSGVLAKLVFDVSPSNRLRLTYDHQDSRVESEVLSSISATTLALTARDETRRDRIALDHRYDGNGGPIDFARWSIYAQQSETTQFTDERRAAPLARRTRLNTFDNRVWGANAEAHSEFTTGGSSHALVFGGDLSVTRQEGLRDGTVPPFGESFPVKAFPDTDYMLAGLFIQDEISLAGGRLLLYPALRYDGYSLEPEGGALFPYPFADQSGGRLSPKLGAVWKVAEAWGLFANYAEGFKAPSPSQVNNGFTNPLINYISEPNPDLKPETSRSFEAGVRYSRGGWFASLTGFTADYEDFIEQVQTGGSFTPADPAVFQFVNLTGVEISGLEAKIEGRSASGVGFVAAASYAEGDYEQAGVSAPLDSVDPWKVVAGVSYRDPGGRFGGQFTVTHVARKGEEDAGGVCAPTCFRPPAFTIADLTAYWNVNEHATLRAGVFNLTDEKYWWWSDVRGLAAGALSTDAYTQPGRNVSVSLVLRL